MKNFTFKSSKKRGLIVFGILIFCILYANLIPYLRFVITQCMTLIGLDSAKELSSAYSVIEDFTAFLFSLSFVTVIVWFYRIYTNYLQLVGQKGGHVTSRVWAVSSWIIPFINLVFPCRYLMQVSTEINNQLLVRGLPIKKTLQNRFIVFWWVLFVFHYYSFIIMHVIFILLWNLNLVYIGSYSNCLTYLSFIHEVLFVVFLITTSVLLYSFVQSENDIKNIPPELSVEV